MGLRVSERHNVDPRVDRVNGFHLFFGCTEIPKFSGCNATEKLDTHSKDAKIRAVLPSYANAPTTATKSLPGANGYTHCLTGARKWVRSQLRSAPAGLQATNVHRARPRKADRKATRA